LVFEDCMVYTVLFYYGFFAIQRIKGFQCFELKVFLCICIHGCDVP